MDRNEAIKTIRAALKRRSGKTWSVTGGRGTAWGWITVTSPPARCNERGGMTEEDRAELEALMGHHVYPQGESIPALGDYYREYIERAEGLPVTKIARPYWD